MNLKLILTSVCIVTVNVLMAQKMSIQEYITTYKDLAIEEMKRSGVPASITLAQGILETENGNSDLVLRSNNHFGIKCKKEWTGEKVFHDDDLRGECFRKYPTAADSYRDHSNFLRGGERYAFLFKLDPTDYKAWAWGLKKAGYATNPKYAITLIKHIENYNLNDYTLIALGKLQNDNSTVKIENKTESTENKIATSENKIETVETKSTEVKPNTIATISVTPTPVNTKVTENTNEKSIPVVVESKIVNVVNEEKPNQTKKETVVVSKINYPSGVFKINETKVLYAVKGTSLLSIAEAQNIPLKYLIDFNDLKNDNVLEKDQLIYLQRKRTLSENKIHIVKPNESLYDIAQAEGVRLDYLIKYNAVPNAYAAIAEGEQVYLQSVAPAAPKLAIEKKPAITYLVQPKETLYSISKKFNVSVETLKTLNNLSSNEVKAGQELIINSN